MKRRSWLFVVVLWTGNVLQTGASEPITPAVIIKQIEEVRTARIAEARAGKPYNALAVQEETHAIAVKATDGVDTDRINASEALDWARLFADADKQKEVVKLTKLYLTTNPNPKTRFDAQVLLLDGLVSTGEGKQIASILPKISAPDPTSGGLLLSKTTRNYVPIIAKAVGLPETFRILNQVEKGIPRENPKTAASTRLTEEKTRREKLGQPKIEDEAAELAKLEQQIRGSWAIRSYFIAKAKADLLVEAGRKTEAIKTLDRFIRGTDTANTVAVRAANSAKAILTLPGQAAPGIQRVSSIGEFAGLDSLKGKVVLLDFFAHWCGPCVASIPDTRKLLEDLKEKGLVVVGVTQYEGYYGRENYSKRDMPRDVEEQKMHGFVQEKGVTWPIVFVERSTFDAYGVQGIPQVVVIDRKGAIRKIEIGYSPESFRTFRAELEDLLSK